MYYPCPYLSFTDYISIKFIAQLVGIQHFLGSETNFQYSKNWSVHICLLSNFSTCAPTFNSYKFLLLTAPHYDSYNFLKKNGPKIQVDDS